MIVRCHHLSHLVNDTDTGVIVAKPVPPPIQLQAFFCSLPQAVKSSLGSCLQNASLRWRPSSSAPRSSGIICTPMTMTPGVSSLGPSRVESLSCRATLGACYSTLTASLKPTTSHCIHWGAGTELERRAGKVKGSTEGGQK